MRKEAQLVTRIASLVLFVVFLGLLASTLLAVTTIKSAVDKMQAAVKLSQQYEYVERQLWKEASLVRVHGVDWQDSNWYTNVYTEHAAANSIASTLSQIADRGSIVDRQLVGLTIAEHDRYVDLLIELFANVDTHDLKAAATTFARSTRMFDIMQARIDQRASEQHAVADASVSDLGATQRRILSLIVFAALIGAVLLAISACVIVRYRSLIERSRAAELLRLAEVSLTDTLTGLGNHRAYQDDLARELARSERHGGTVSLALIDVDNFKTVNDTKGHIEGDRVLATLGTLLKGLRKSDQGFRLGGDEFAVVLPHTESAEALATMDRLRQEVVAALAGGTISIGISSTKEHEVDAIALRAQADSALYAAKHHGRNSVMTYEDARTHAFVRSTEKEHAVRELIAEGSMEAVFQPIWDIRSPTPLGFEALVRPADKYGLAGPQEAFDLAEQMGLAPALDAIALRAILRRAKELPADTLLFINIVPETLMSHYFTQGVFFETVAASGLIPQRVVIELTERSMQHLDAIIAGAKQLQARGFRIALDDTGAGNAGLDVLRNLSVDFVKIDRSVVVQAMIDPIARAIVAGIIEIARAMGSYVIAEGIETNDMLEFICCQITHPIITHTATGGVQGYLLGKPDGKPWSAPYASSAQSLLSQSGDVLQRT